MEPQGRPREGSDFFLDREFEHAQLARVAFAPELECDARMDQFIATHTDKLQGVLSCFDRVLFRGYLPFFSGYAMASFLEARGVYRRDGKRCVVTQAYRLKDHARQMAAREGRPDHYFGERPGTEDLARPVAEREGITEGLVGVVATVEPGRTFSLRGREGAAFIP